MRSYGALLMAFSHQVDT